MKQTGLAVLVLTLTLGTAACNRAEEGVPATVEPDNMVGTTGALGERDAREFLERAAASNMAEVELGRLAQERARHPQVKQFAERMVQEHQAALNELRQAAGNIQLPAALEEEHRDLQQRLSQLQGAEFDREYMRAMVNAHEETVDLLKSRAEQQGAAPAAGADRPAAPAAGMTTGNQDQPLSRWAASALPKVQAHLEQARQINQSLQR